MSKRERHVKGYCLFGLFIWICALIFCPKASAETKPDGGAVMPSSVTDSESAKSHIIPEIVKTRPYPVIDILKEALGKSGSSICNNDILFVKVIPLGKAKGFAYFDGRTTWNLRYNAADAKDLDNDTESNCWKIIGGMTEDEKKEEFDLFDEGGAAPGASGTGEIDIRIFFRNKSDGISIETVRAKVVLKKLIIEVDWMEGSVIRTISRGDTRRITFKPVINREFINAFGQAGIEVVIADTPEKGNKHNTIPKNALFSPKLHLNRENLADLLPDQYRGWRKDVKLFNEGISYIAKGIINQGYMDFDSSRADVIYVIGAQRWTSLPGDEIQQTRGATAIFEKNGKWHNVAFIFNLSIAESTASVNKTQEIQIPWNVAAVHTVLHECTAHCFPLRWKNSETEMALDDYWGDWRCLFIGHSKRNDYHEYGRVYRTCVTSSESTLDAAYYTWLGEPRLSDFSNLIGNNTAYKSRDIIRDYVVEGEAKKYGREINDKRVVTKRETSPASLSHH